MKNGSIYRSSRALLTLALIFTIVGCVPVVSVSEPTVIPAPSSTPAPAATPTVLPAVENTEVAPSPEPHTEPAAAASALYQDDFTDPSSGWPEAKFDNYFIGYHEPEYYHIEIDSPHSRTAVYLPEKPTFSDLTIEVKVQTNSTKTAATGDYIYGPVFRRSGDQYYAFAISTVHKKWYVLKSSPTELVTLAEGSDTSIHDPDSDDTLRIDAQGSNFYFHLNGHLVSQMTDADYPSGEVGFYVQTFDSPQAHIHFDELSIRNFEMPDATRPQSAPLYQDALTNPSSGWPEAKFDNYFIGYHEPEYYHVEIDSPNSKTSVFVPGKPTFDNATIEVKVQANSTKTAATGDYIYGPVFRRSGDQYYAFAISTVNKKWYVLKSSPSELLTLAEGSDASIHDLDADDTLRVDAQGSNFYFHLNGHLVNQMNDPDYASGEVGFYVQTFDSPQAHIHFDDLTIWNFEAPGMCTIETTAKLNVRKGPGTSFPAAFSLSKGDAVEPMGRNPDGKWIKVGLEGREERGWVANSPQFISCNTDIKTLPVIIGP